MFSLAILIGIFSYTIFFLGLLRFLYKEVIVGIILICAFWVIFFLINKFSARSLINKVFYYFKKKTKLELLFLLIILAQAFVNLIGTLGPELGFDALWYHLTLPKIYLINHAVNFIPGGLFYYSSMPQLTEMLYVVGLTLGNEIIAKLIHFSFGILCLTALYNLSRMFLPRKLSLLVLVLFYSNLVVGWMSISAYVDLARSFFEIMSLWVFLKWFKKNESKWFIMSAILLGLAISTKLLALGSLFIFTILIIVFTHRLSRVLTYWLVCLLIPLPWFIFSYIHTGNPFYPFFTGIYPIKLNIGFINPLTLSDPISPLYVIFLPLALFFYKKFTPSLKIISLYSFLAIAVWYLTPQTGGGRFIMPYLPAFSIVSVVIIGMVKKTAIQRTLVGTIILFALFSILYRGTANAKYVPVILGKESKSHFLANHLNFSFGDFYDTDEYFSKTITKKDKVLLYGFHNLYYVNFPFIDSSFVNNGDMFNYIAVQGGNIPEGFKWWGLIYYNMKTNIKLYSIGGEKWAY